MKLNKQDNTRLPKTKRGEKGLAKSVLIFGLALFILIIGIAFRYFTKSSAPSEVSSEKFLEVEKLKFDQAVGKEAPDFVLQDINGNTVKLNDYRGKIVVLFFNEGAMCYPACWDQMTAFGNDEKFNTNDVAVFSIVIDQKSEWEEIVSQIPQFSKTKILFDSDRKVSTAYDVLSLSSSMHPPSAMHPGGYPGHTYFIIDKEGVVRYVFDDPDMGIRNNQLTAEISKLSQGGAGNRP